jgi:hypothetical protein
MIKVFDRLSFGDESTCHADTSGGSALVHACKDPCHRRAVGYSGRSLPKTHEHYLAKETEFHLFLNIIDPELPLFMPQSFISFLAFTDKHIAERPVHVHCNQGESRAPSLALLYLAKRTALLPNTSFAAAAAEFVRNHHPGYHPGRGIQTWLAKNWDAFA